MIRDGWVLLSVSFLTSNNSDSRIVSELFVVGSDGNCSSILSQITAFLKVEHRVVHRLPWVTGVK